MIAVGFEAVLIFVVCVDAGIVSPASPAIHSRHSRGGRPIIAANITHAARTVCPFAIHSRGGRVGGKQVWLA